MKKNRFRSLLLFCLCFATMLSFVGCFGSGGKADTTAYQAKEDELKYNSLSDEGKFVLYKASLSDEELEKLKDKKAADLKGEEKEKKAESMVASLWLSECSSVLCMIQQNQLLVKKREQPALCFRS